MQESDEWRAERFYIQVKSSNDQTSIDFFKYFLVLFPQQIIQHPHYSFIHKKNDIALIRLTQRIHFTAFVRPACLETNMNDVDPTVKLITFGKGIDR